MNLLPYLHTAPQSEAELDQRVPVGTSIPIYLFPDMRALSRVRVLDQPSAEAYRQSAMATLNHSLAGLAVTAAILFVLIRLRRFCFAADPDLAIANQAQAG